MGKKYLTFTVGKGDYAIAVTQVAEIIGLRPITWVPFMPGCIKGVINLRGKILTVIDSYELLRKKTIKEPALCMLVVILEEEEIGLLVDKVEDVMEFEKDALEYLEVSKQDKLVSCIGKKEGRVWQLVDGAAIEAAVWEGKDEET